MGHHVDYSTAESKGCSSRLKIEDKVFYVKLLESSKQPARYFAADQKGTITKEISQTEFNFWLETLSDDEAEIKQIKNKLGSGRKYHR